MVGRSDRTDRTEERIIPGADRKWKYRRSSEKEICEELGVNSMKVIAVASHDTQSASAAVPTQEKILSLSVVVHGVCMAQNWMSRLLEKNHLR